jgi:hypothetical protein
MCVRQDEDVDVGNLAVMRKFLHIKPHCVGRKGNDDGSRNILADPVAAWLAWATRRV